jgi:hypothetical protein
MAIILVKALLILAIIPIGVSVYLASLDRLKAETWIRRWIWNWAFLLLFLSIVGALVLEVWSYERSTASADAGRPLHFMPLEAYERELDSVQQKPQDWETGRQELVRKFEFAQYAYDQHDYPKAIDAFSELESGQDAMGPLFHVASYVVANDLGCAYFKKQRNRGFWASRYIVIAQSRVGPNSMEQHTLDDNLSILDELVNRLD